VPAHKLGMTGKHYTVRAGSPADMRVKAHAARSHVVHIRAGKKAVVKISGTASSIGKIITIERSVKRTSNADNHSERLQNAESSRSLKNASELRSRAAKSLKYILTPPGKLMTDVQIRCG